MFPFDHPENISDVFRGIKRKHWGEKGLELQEAESIANITKLRLNLYISIILYLIALKYFPYFNSLLLCLIEPFKKPPVPLHFPRSKKVIFSENIFILPVPIPFIPCTILEL